MEEVSKHSQARLDPSWFACPACGKALESALKEYRCNNCNTSYPIKCGIPLFATEQIDERIMDEKKFWENEYRADEDGTFHAFTEKANIKILKQLQIPADVIGLDFACGSGTFGSAMEGQTVVGLDLSYPLLKTSSGIIPIQGSGMNLPFRSELFDFVLCAAALHHMPDPETSLSEIVRVTKPGGVIGIVELNTSHPQRKLVASSESPFRKLFPTTGFSPSERLIKAKDLVDWLKKMECDITEMTYFTPPYSAPSFFGKIQKYVSTIAGRGIFKRYVESYLTIRAVKR